MSEKILPLSRPDISEAEIQAVVSVLRSDRLSMGPHTKAFEAAVAERARRKYGVAVNSGTSGLHLCVKALGIGEGDEVITTPFSFVATTNCLLFERARPVFVDIDPDNYNADPAAVEAAITPRTKAILPVEVFGNTAYFDEYERIAVKHHLLLLEDCCEAMGGYLADRPAGSFGEASVFGFYPNKQITTGEGGVVVTDRQDIRAQCIAMRNQGRFANAPPVHVILGYNYRMSEIIATMGAAQMNRLDEILVSRRQSAEMYNEALAGIEEIHLPPMADVERASWFVYVIRLADEFAQTNRDLIIAEMRAEGIGCSNYFVPIHFQPYISEILGTKPGDFPVTERVAARVIALPFFGHMTAEQIARVKQVLVKTIRRHRGA